MEDSPPSEIPAAIVEQLRLDELSDCDSSVIGYDPASFLMIFRLRGRNMAVILKPLGCLAAWGALWALVFSLLDPVRRAMLPLEDLIAPLLPPVSFLLVFRLGRAAVRFWDSRAAMGKLVEVCRVLASTAAVCCASHAELREGIARWTCVFPIAVKNFLRPLRKQGVSPELRLKNRRIEVGGLLSEPEFDELVRADSYGPIFVLNRLRQLAFRASVELEVDAPLRAIIFRQMNEHLDTLTGAWGAMERINGTPLPYVYIAHLRTFLVVYLLIWALQAIAHHGALALPVVLAVSWGFLGIEAAAVECERPFLWGANHLKLGTMCIVVARNVAQTLRDTS
ncbi:hypothetical protein AB1Y20_010831 [Prymnesium parvum]|uniref:Bestrophin homolog n=1 Tax=Prymnesium parvum TaxID=97485 RepID=A0AB34IQK5_PRYPA